MTERVGRTARYLDKYLFNFERLGMLSVAYPNAIFLKMRRDPRSIALSIYSNAMMVDAHPYSTRLEDIAAYFLHFERVMAHWHGFLSDRIVEVNYEELVNRPEEKVRELLRQVGLSWNDACLSPEEVAGRVKTLSMSQVRSGISNKPVEKWRRF